MIECIALLVVSGAAGVLNGGSVDVRGPGWAAGEQADAGQRES
jgi:hypothetical protein